MSWRNGWQLVKRSSDVVKQSAANESTARHSTSSSSARRSSKRIIEKLTGWDWRRLGVSCTSGEAQSGREGYGRRQRGGRQRLFGRVWHRYSLNCLQRHHFEPRESHAEELSKRTLRRNVSTEQKISNSSRRADRDNSDLSTPSSQNIRCHNERCSEFSGTAVRQV